MSWPLVKFKDVAVIVTGSTPEKSEDNYGGVIPFVTPGDLGSKSEISVAKVTLTDDGAKSGRLLPPNAVLVCCIGATIGKTGIAVTPVVTNQQINSLIFDETKVFPKYAYFFCKTLTPFLVNRSTSTTMPIVNKSSFSEIEIPLPPLEEQKRIAAILDKADAIRRKRQQAIKLADDFLRSVFLEMFGDPVTNPKGWEVVELNQLVDPSDKLNYGVVQPGNEEADGTPLVRSGDLSDFTPDINSLRRISASVDKKHKNSKLKGNEILIACVGSIGRVGWVTEEMKGWNIARAVTRIPVRREVNREYLYRYLQNPVVQGYFEKETRAVAQPTLNVSLIAKTPIALPPEKLQMEFLSVHKKAVAQRDKYIFTLQQQSELFESLNQKAFLGQL